MIKILVVEDDYGIRDLIELTLKMENYTTITAKDGEEALNKIENEKFDLILLDVMMPKLNGFSVCKKIRTNIDNIYNKKDIPIIFITAKSDEDDNLYGYEIGSDDYVTKPFSLNILYAKCITHIKRYKGINNEEKLYANEICIDVSKNKVFMNKEEVKLPKMEYDLLYYFILNKNRIIKREQLLIKFWGYDFDGNDRVLDTHIKKLRNSLGHASKYLHTIIKVGYRFEVNSDESW